VLPKRWGNVRELSCYITHLKEGNLPFSYQEVLDKNKVEFEYIFLHLRLKEGINTQDYRDRFKSNFYKKYETVLNKLMYGGFIYKLKDRILLTKRGWLLADEIASSF
jgi:coproporphyrinogen III oxidase-like Fe-S oxidoreductase